MPLTTLCLIMNPLVDCTRMVGHGGGNEHGINWWLRESPCILLILEMTKFCLGHVTTQSHNIKVDKVTSNKFFFSCALARCFFIKEREERTTALYLKILPRGLGVSCLEFKIPVLESVTYSCSGWLFIFLSTFISELCHNRKLIQGIRKDNSIRFHEDAKNISTGCWWQII